MISIRVQGIDAVIRKFDELEANSKGIVQTALNDWADRTATDAKQLVASNSSDEGNLLRSIFPVYGQGGASVVASTRYAAYIEFGTRKFAASYVGSLPEDWQKLAESAKGPGIGSFKDMIASLTAWCKRKGIDEKLAYPIAKKILINGIKPRPFLYPAATKNYSLLVKDIKALLR